MGTRGWRRFCAPVVVVVGLLVGAGCLSDEQKAEAQEVALGDPRLAEMLAAHPYEVTDVRSGNEPHDEYAVVVIEFGEPFPDSEWPLDVCSIGGHDHQLTGVSWVVDLGADAVAGVSPVWGEVDCTGGW